MDNVTHTLVGTLLGETAARYAPPATNKRQASVRRMMFLSVMIVGSNLPDADLLYSLGSDSKLAYLLEHRGHTHTVLGALLGSAAMLFACWLWQGRGSVSLSSKDWILLAALAALAPLLHIAMDALNTYGVHPWWPLDNRWFYGDSVFIVEPLFWASAAPLAFLLQSAVGRALVVLSLLAALYLAFVTGIVAHGSIVVFCMLAIIMLAIGRYARPRVALLAAIAACVAVTAVFVIAHRQALARVDAVAAAELPGWTTLDRVLTPLPMNPLCWEVILVQASDDRYALRRASVSIGASIGCPTAMGAPITAPLTRVPVPDTPFVHWHGEIVASAARLRALAASSCEVAALLRFARAPWFEESDERRVAGDLRYDREPELGFAEIDLARSPRCPAYVPPWTPPRMDLMLR